MKNLLKSKKGFTLVEILIVIAIIGILVVIIVPNAVNAYRNYRLNSTKTDVSATIIKTLETGITSGSIPLSEEVATAKGITLDDDNVLISTVTDKTAPIDIAKVAGIKNYYDLPTNNADLLDPLATDKATGNYRVYWDDTNDRVFVTNSASAALVEHGGTAVGIVEYANTQSNLANPYMLVKTRLINIWYL